MHGEEYCLKEKLQFFFEILRYFTRNKLENLTANYSILCPIYYFFWEESLFTNPSMNPAPFVKIEQIISNTSELQIDIFNKVVKEQAKIIKHEIQSFLDDLHEKLISTNSKLEG